MRDKTMIERMARAAEAAHHMNAPPLAPDSWKSWVPIIKAILITVRDPGKVVVKDAARAEGISLNVARKLWQNVIDAALEGR